MASTIKSVAAKLMHPRADSGSIGTKADKTNSDGVHISKDSSGLNSPKNGPVEDLGDTSNDSSHIREVTKQIRNINKKLNSMAKVDAIIAANPDSSLDQLVDSRKINQDQKNQATKKPQLQSQLVALEAQLVLYRQLEEAHCTKSTREKEALLAAHAEEIKRVAAAAKTEAEAHYDQALRSKLLTFSRFLAEAATRRNLNPDASSEESRAFEGALLLVYGGNLSAVEAAEKIIDGSSELVPSTEGDMTQVTFALVKELTLQGSHQMSLSLAADANSNPNPESTLDPTSANPASTTLDDSAGFLANGTDQLTSVQSTASATDSPATNRQWNSSIPDSQAASGAQQYETNPRAIVENGTGAQPLGAHADQQSWSDEVAAASELANGGTPSGLANNDGFHQVPHRGGRRGNGGGHRGEGFRGGERGRGRGGRGFRGGDRGYRGRGGSRGRGRGEAAAAATTTSVAAAAQ